MIEPKLTSAGEYFYQKSQNGGTNIFIRDFTNLKTYTFLELWQEIEYAASFLDELGVRKKDKIILQMDNTVPSLAMFMGAIVANVIPIPLSPQIAGKELNTLCKRCNVVYVLTSTNIVKTIHSFLSIPVLSIDAYQKGTPRKIPFDITCDLDDVAYVTLTTGSTDVPKAVTISHRNMLAEIESMAEVYGLDSSHRHLCVLPIYHASGLYRNIFVPFHLGSSVVLLNEFDCKTFWNVVIEEEIHFVQVVPYILQSLLIHADKTDPGRDIPLRYIGSASAPHPPELIKSFEKRFGIYVLLGYGMTEATCAITLNPINKKDRKLGSVGKALTVNKIEIRDENNKHLPLGETGRVMVSGMNMSLSILSTYGDDNDNELNRYDGWFDTGDIGYLDTDGFLWLLGRRKDIIKRGSYRVSPYEIEKAIYNSFPNIEVAVMGVYDPLIGQDVIAFIDNKRDDHLTSRKIIREIKGDIASYKIPSKILFVDGIPKLGVGKVDRDKLMSYYQDLQIEQRVTYQDQ